MFAVCGPCPKAPFVTLFVRGGRHSNAGIKKCLWAALGSVSKFAARLGTDLSSLLIHLGRNRLGLGRHLPRPCKAAQTITKHFGSSHTALLLPPLEEAGSEGLQREAQASTTSVTTCHCLQWSEYPALPSYERDAATKGFTCSQLVTLRMMLDVEEPSVYQQMCLRHSCSISLYRHKTKDQLSHKILSSLGSWPGIALICGCSRFPASDVFVAPFGEGVFDVDWRIRHGAVQLMGQLPLVFQTCSCGACSGRIMEGLVCTNVVPACLAILASSVRMAPDEAVACKCLSSRGRFSEAPFAAG